jgi:ankyrin repeat protein
LSKLPDFGKDHEVQFNRQIIPAKRITQERLRRQFADANVEELPPEITIHLPIDVKFSSRIQETIAPEPEWSLVDRNTYSIPLMASSPVDMPMYSGMEWQHHPISLGIFEPHAWTQAIDWSLLASSMQRNTRIAKLFHFGASDLNSVVRSSINNSQLIVRGSDFLIPFYLLSALLNGTEPSGRIKNSQLHGILRALPKSVVLKLFEKLESPYSDMLRERVFASALDAGDPDIVEAMLSLGLDPCERIWFDSGFNSGCRLPLQRALYFDKFSVCKAIVKYRCSPQFGLTQAFFPDEVLRELLESYYRLASRHFPLSSAEWQDFSDLIRISLSRGAHLTNECFFVAYHDHGLAKFLTKLEPTGVNGWIKRGLLALRWPDAQHCSSQTKQVESRYVHWILTYILRQHQNQIDREDPEIVAELQRALETAVITSDPGALHIVVEACTRIKVEFHSNPSGEVLADRVTPRIQQGQAYTQALIEECDSGDCLSDSEEDHTIAQGHSKSYKNLYETITKEIRTGSDPEFSRVVKQYLNNADLRYYIHTQDDRVDQQLFRLAVKKKHLEMVVVLFKSLTFDYPRRLELHWSLAHVLQTGNTAAMSAILRDSEPLAEALASTEADTPTHFPLEDLLYRVQGTSLLCLSESNAHQQILLRCICYHAIHTNNKLLLIWLVNNGLDMGEFGIHLNGELYQVFFENMQKTTPHNGLMSNKGCGFPVQIFPSLISIAAMENNVSMIRLLLVMGADGKDSMALARAVQTGADVSTIEVLLQAAGSENKKSKVRHYGSAALRETIRRKDYNLLRSLAQGVDVDGIELLPNEMSDPRSVEPLSPLGEAILMQDIVTVRILLEEGSNSQSLICYDGFPEEHNRGAYLRRLSPLLAAIDLQNLPIVQLLVEYGAPVNPGPTQGILRSPLQRAAEVGCFEIVKYLISCGAPVDDPPFYSGGTPLQLAAMSGHDEVVELLIENHADPNYPPAAGDGRSAFEAAAEWGRANIMTLLIKRGVHLDLKFEDDSRSQYDRALHFAEHNGHPASKRFVQRLYEDVVAAGSGLSLTNPSGSTHRENLLEKFLVETGSLSWIPDDRPLFVNP